MWNDNPFMIYFTCILLGIVCVLNSINIRNNRLEIQRLQEENTDLQLKVMSMEYRFDKAMSFACYLLTGDDPEKIIAQVCKRRHNGRTNSLEVIQSKTVQ